MILELTISQLDSGAIDPEKAAEQAQLGYMQWLGALPADADYHDEVRRAYALAQPFERNSPAIAVFCDLLVASLQMPPRPLPLSLPQRARRGGAQARRLSL
ncbi:MAG: hypothetical protein AAF686_08380 [Pseudomonadota bacterium]